MGIRLRPTPWPTAGGLPPAPAHRSAGTRPAVACWSILDLLTLTRAPMGPTSPPTRPPRATRALRETWQVWLERCPHTGRPGLLSPGRPLHPSPAGLCLAAEEAPEWAGEDLPLYLGYCDVRCPKLFCKDWTARPMGLCESAGQTPTPALPGGRASADADVSSPFDDTGFGKAVTMAHLPAGAAHGCQTTGPSPV